jgi:predicted DNA-binding transcriptional regulator AlpA
MTGKTKAPKAIQRHPRPPAITRLPDDPDALIDTNRVLAVLPIDSRMTLWRWVKAGKFPEPHKLHNGRNSWTVRVTRGWLRDQAAK